MHTIQFNALWLTDPLCPVCDGQLTTSNLASAEINSSVSVQLASSGLTAPLTFIVSDGTLPTGVSLSSGGLLSGVPSVIKAFAFTVHVNDTNGCEGESCACLYICVKCVHFSLVCCPLMYAASLLRDYTQQVASNWTSTHALVFIKQHTYFLSSMASSASHRVLSQSSETSTYTHPTTRTHTHNSTHIHSIERRFTRGCERYQQEGCAHFAWIFLCVRVCLKCSSR